MGAYIGWIDDIEDLLVDLSVGRWNLVSTDLYEYLGQPRNISPAELIARLLDLLGSDDVQQKIVTTGLNHYTGLVDALDVINIDSGPLLQLVQDTTLAGLQDDEMTSVTLPD